MPLMTIRVPTFDNSMVAVFRIEFQDDALTHVEFPRFDLKYEVYDPVDREYFPDECCVEPHTVEQNEAMELWFRHKFRTKDIRIMELVRVARDANYEWGKR